MDCVANLKKRKSLRKFVVGSLKGKSPAGQEKG